MTFPRQNRRFILLLLSIQLIPILSVASTGSNKPLPVRLSIGNQDVGMGMENLFSAANPSALIGTEFYYSKNSRHRIGQTFELGFSHNAVLGNSVSWYTAAFYRYTHKSGILGEFSIGPGLTQQYHPRQVYEYDPSKGIYEKAKDRGTTALNLGYGLALGYNFEKKKGLPLAVFVRYNFRIQTPYFALDMFPIMPQSFTGIGFTYKISK